MGNSEAKTGGEGVKNTDNRKNRYASTPLYVMIASSGSLKIALHQGMIPPGSSLGFLLHTQNEKEKIASEPRKSKQRDSNPYPLGANSLLG